MASRLTTRISSIRASCSIPARSPWWSSTCSTRAARATTAWTLAEGPRPGGARRLRFDRIERTVVPTIQRLLAFFRAPAGSAWSISPWARSCPTTPICCRTCAPSPRAPATRGATTSTRSSTRSPRAPGEAVLNKTTMSAFHSSGFERLVRAWGVEQLVFTGISTNSCVEGTARDAVDRGFRCVLVEDGCGAASQSLHEATCANFARLLGRVGLSAQVLAELEGARGRVGLSRGATAVPGRPELPRGLRGARSRPPMKPERGRGSPAARQRYQAAAERYGFHCSPSTRRPLAWAAAARRRPGGSPRGRRVVDRRMSARPSVKISSISTVHRPDAADRD